MGAQGAYRPKTAASGPGSMEFQDGRDYYATVVAQNRAGLRTTVSSNAFRLDRTPPRPGEVFVAEPWRSDAGRYYPSLQVRKMLSWPRSWANFSL
jgi:hypothetical protein